MHRMFYLYGERPSSVWPTAVHSGSGSRRIGRAAARIGARQGGRVDLGCPGRTGGCGLVALLTMTSYLTYSASTARAAAATSSATAPTPTVPILGGHQWVPADRPWPG